MHRKGIINDTHIVSYRPTVLTYSSHNYPTVLKKRTLLWLGHDTESLQEHDSNSLVSGSLKGYKGIMLSLSILVLSMTMQQVFRVKHNGLW